MSKLLFWIGVILVVLVVMRLIAHRSAARTAESRRASRRASPRRVDAMVQCAHCGVHLPSSEALHFDGKQWCSPEHARLGSPE